MNMKTTAASVAALMMAGGIAAGPAAAQGGRQNDKNLMRNLGIAAAAGAVHQAVTGKTTNALILGAGAVYAGKKYEDARKAQARESSRRYGYNSDSYRYSRNSDNGPGRSDFGRSRGRKVGYYTRSAHARR
jgi:hypothetical protein